MEFGYKNSGGKTIEISGNEKIEAAIGVALMVSNKLNAIVLDNKIWAKSVNNAAAVNGIQIVSCNNATKLELNLNIIKYSLNNNFPNNSYYGIRVNGCNRIKVLNNNVETGQYLNLNTNGIRLSQTTNAIVKDNTVYGTGVPKENTSGIYVTSSSNWQICYNHLSKIRKGVEFYSASPSPKRFSHNDMTDHTVGLELDPSSVIGVQYSLTNPFAGGSVLKYTMGNQWVSGLTVGARFLTENQQQVDDSFFGVNQNSQPDRPDVIECKFKWFGGGYTEFYPCNDLFMNGKWKENYSEILLGINWHCRIIRLRAGG
ncbi:MAG: right-handed parallel beta-helix repeat-containing protein [Saprospiraceae bacterium]|nr:right-handed parallel beta-helix repeat-containing protein [Saprospiraceae bacterium]